MEIPQELLKLDYGVNLNDKRPDHRYFFIQSEDSVQKTVPKHQFAEPKAESLSYGKGDRVSHIKFGQGTVMEIVSGGRDYEVTVGFLINTV